MENKKYKGSIMINGIIEQDSFPTDPDKRQRINDAVSAIVDNAGGLQWDDQYFDIDAEAPRQNLEQALEDVERIRQIIYDIDADAQLDIGLWIYIEDFFTVEDAKPTISYSIHHPEGVPGINRSFCGEFMPEHNAFCEMPTPVTPDFNALVKVPADQIEFGLD